MSDSGSSSVGEARMLERRVSNNRADLSGDQQMNYFLAWFNSWSDLQRSDFVPVLADKMSADGKAGGSARAINGGLSDALQSMDFSNSGRPPSLFACQVKLFRDWFAGWSDDQKNYLVVRLRDVDADFFTSYESYLQNPESHHRVKKDYFEPGIPPELVNTPTVVAAAAADEEERRKSSRPGAAGDAHGSDGEAQEEEEEGEGEHQHPGKRMSGSGSLSPISETV